MEQNMFCFQCEQTAGCTGCTGAKGVCGKTADTARLQDELTGALIGLSHAADENTPLAETDMETDGGRFICYPYEREASMTKPSQKSQTASTRKKPGFAQTVAAALPLADITDDYDMKLLWNAQEDIRSLKSLILFGIRGMAAYAYHAMALGYTDDRSKRIFRKSTFCTGRGLGYGPASSYCNGSR